MLKPEIYYGDILSWGEDTGEGELNRSSGRRPALNEILTSGGWILTSGSIRG